MAILIRSISQTWPPFVFVSGLLLIGRVAASDGLFAWAGSRLALIPGSARVLYFAMMALVATVTVFLNLDTSIVFLTPIILHVARRRKLDDHAFLYGSIFMANAASLLLPGSNLTNLLVVSSIHVTGVRFAAAMLPPWIVAVTITATVIAIWQWRQLGDRRETEIDVMPFHAGFGIVGIVISTILVLVLSNPAPLIFLLGVVLVLAQMSVIGRMSLRTTLRATNFELLLGLFLVAVAAGVIGRIWNVPHRLLGSLSPLATVGLSAGLANLLNNLPATMLLASQRPPRPEALLIGLNLGPNLCVIGAMSSLLWLRISRAAGAKPSVKTFTLLGLIVTPLSALVATIAFQHLAFARL
ncbi:MAG TPA: SLC13 family permease [Acidimicrobiales bacterium]|nr:SLC13 family permease [Acidimicrobiales bacterium]